MTVLHIAEQPVNDVDQLWRLDNIGIHPDDLSNDEKHAVEYFENNIEYNNGKYICRLPWRSNVKLDLNYSLAKGRLENNLRNLRKTPEIL